MSAQTRGADVSARWFDVARDGEVRRFANTPDGIAACLAWLAELGGSARVGMEATGSYHLPLATALQRAGHTVLVCNPLSIARYAEAVLARTKTDATDARLIARFCGAHEVAPWTPVPAAQQRLRALLTTRETLCGPPSSSPPPVRPHRAGGESRPVWGSWGCLIRRRGVS